MFYRPGKRFFSLRGFELVIMYSIFSGVFGLPYRLASLLMIVGVSVHDDTVDSELLMPHLYSFCYQVRLQILGVH